MRRLLLNFFLAIMVFELAQGQTPAETANSILNSELIALLENDGILLKDSDISCETNCPYWKKNKEKQKYLAQDNLLRQILLKSFAIPPICDGKPIQKDLIFKDTKYARLGSYIIRNEDFTVMNGSTEPTLPVLLTGNQISVPVPVGDKSNYVINLTSNALFRGTSNVQGDASFLNYFNGKFAASAQIDNSKTMQISVGAGNFKNQLATLYDNTINGNLTTLEFGPIYELWTEYSKGTILPNDKIISSFDGMCYYTSKGTSSKDVLTFDGTMDGSGKVPFLSLKYDATAKWLNSGEISAQNNTYYVYMFKKPALKAIPSVDNVIKAWNGLNRGSTIPIPSNNLIPTNAPLVLDVTFGPIPDKRLLPLVQLDDDYWRKNLPNGSFIERLNLITYDQNAIKISNDNFYTFKLEVWRNEAYVQQNINLNEIATADLNLRIYFNQGIKGKYLDKVYPAIKVRTEGYPTPYIDNNQNDTDLIPDETDPDYFKYKGTAKFKTSNIAMVVSNTPVPIKVMDVAGIPKNYYDELKKELQRSKFSPKGPNSYDLTISLPKSKKYFDENNRAYDLDLIVSFNTSDGTPYTRKLPIILVGPKIQTVITSTVASVQFKDNAQLINALNEGAKLQDGSSLGILKQKFMKSDGQVDTLLFLEALKKQTNLTLNSDNSYIISTAYLVPNKIN